MQVKLDAEEVRELRLAVQERASALTKLRTKMEKAGLSTKDVDSHVEICLGDGVTTGLMDKLSEQLSILEARDPWSEGLGSTVDMDTGEIEGEGSDDTE